MFVHYVFLKKILFLLFKVRLDELLGSGSHFLPTQSPTMNKWTETKIKIITKIPVQAPRTRRSMASCLDLGKARDKPSMGEGLACCMFRPRLLSARDFPPRLLERFNGAVTSSSNIEVRSSLSPTSPFDLNGKLLRKLLSSALDRPLPESERDRLLLDDWRLLERDRLPPERARASHRGVRAARAHNGRVRVVGQI